MTHEYARTSTVDSSEFSDYTSDFIAENHAYSALPDGEVGLDIINPSNIRVIGESQAIDFAASFDEAISVYSHLLAGEHTDDIDDNTLIDPTLNLIVLDKIAIKFDGALTSGQIAHLNQLKSEQLEYIRTRPISEASLVTLNEIAKASEEEALREEAVETFETIVESFDGNEDDTKELDLRGIPHSVREAARLALEQVQNAVGVDVSLEDALNHATDIVGAEEVKAAIDEKKNQAIRKIMLERSTDERTASDIYKNELKKAHAAQREVEHDNTGAVPIVGDRYDPFADDEELPEIEISVPVRK